MPDPTAPDPQALAKGHVLVAGVGGLGCPAAWALAQAGVGRLTLLDPDRVESSNLPRQVLFLSGDLGRPKAEVAARRLARKGVVVRGLAAPLDERNEAELLADVDLVLDATDGARTKDWLNALCVRRRLGLVHAAAIRSEGRLLEVPAGGRPCLACLFGRLDREAGRCADLGVWNGVVGATGFLAAAAALARLADPARPSPGYVMLDLEAGRAVTLGAAASAGCPVCGDAARLGPEPLPAPEACAAVPAPEGAGSVAAVVGRLDLRGEVCPLNLLRARRAVEDLGVGERVEILLGAEGADSVPDGLRSLGHLVLEEDARGEGGRVIVERGGRDSATHRLERDALLRYARQVVLPEIGEDGQARLLGAHVRLEGRGPTFEAAAMYLEASGVGRVERVAPPQETPGGLVRARIQGADDALGSVEYGAHVAADGAGRVVAGRVETSGAELPVAEALALGALLADRVERAVVTGSATEPTFGIRPGPRIQA